MKRYFLKAFRKSLFPVWRTRCYFSRMLPHVLKLLKPLALLTAVSVFTLVLIPFTVTRLFVPETSQSPISHEKQPSSVTDSIQKIPVPDTISVWRQDSSRTDTVNFEEYVKGVVASEMPSSFEKEALKAQAVAARTYSLAKYRNAQKSTNPSSHPGAPVCDTVHCQVYQDQTALKKNKGSQWMKEGWKKISEAVQETKGQLLYYNGHLVQQALFHSSSGGRTENCENVFAAAVPYLVSVESPYEQDATHKKETKSLSVSEFSRILKQTFPSKNFGTVTSENIKIIKRSSGDRVETLQVGNSTVTGRQVREALGLYSANFTISLSKDNITFTTKGSGHGVGMSQYGANGMAQEGFDYKEILSHYYSGTVVY